MKEAAKIYTIIVPKGKEMSEEVNKIFKNQSSIISRNYCSNEMHVPTYIDAILSKPIDFNYYNLIILTIGDERIKKQIQKLKLYIHKFNKPRQLTLAKWRSFKKNLLAFIVYNYFDVKTNREVSQLCGLSEYFTRLSVNKINTILDNPDPYVKSLKEIIQKTINFQKTK